MNRYGYIIRGILKYFKVKYLYFILKHFGQKTILNVDETRLEKKSLLKLGEEQETFIILISLLLYIVLKLHN